MHLTATGARSNCSVLPCAFLQLWRSLLSVRVELNPPPFLLLGDIEAQDPQAWWCRVVGALYMERTEKRVEVRHSVVLRLIRTHQSGSQQESFCTPTSKRLQDSQEQRQVQCGLSLALGTGPGCPHD